MKYAAVLPDVYNDPRISHASVHAFCILLDCMDPKTRLSAISLPTLAKRLGNSRKHAVMTIRELTAAQHIRNVQTVTGKCAIYEVLSYAPIPASAYNLRRRRAPDYQPFKPEDGGRFKPPQLSPEQYAESDAEFQRVMSPKRVPA